MGISPCTGLSHDSQQQAVRVHRFPGGRGGRGAFCDVSMKKPPCSHTSPKRAAGWASRRGIRPPLLPHAVGATGVIRSRGRNRGSPAPSAMPRRALGKCDLVSGFEYEAPGTISDPGTECPEGTASVSKHVDSNSLPLCTVLSLGDPGCRAGGGPGEAPIRHVWVTDDTRGCSGA